jgi:formylmethanofuran dehydrogenase subunit E
VAGLPHVRADFDTEMYVYYGTNEYNFEKLANPPTYEPTKCSKCGKVIVLSKEGFSVSDGKYQCEKCTELEFSKLLRPNRK